MIFAGLKILFARDKIETYTDYSMLDQSLFLGIFGITLALLETALRDTWCDSSVTQKQHLPHSPPCRTVSYEVAIVAKVIFVLNLLHFDACVNIYPKFRKFS